MDERRVDGGREVAPVVSLRLLLPRWVRGKRGTVEVVQNEGGPLTGFLA